MGKTVRRKNYKPEWVDNTVRYHSDSGTWDEDDCPPKWFRKKQHKKWRKKENQRIASSPEIEDEVFHEDFKMPYYT